MHDLPERLQKKLNEREDSRSLRKLLVANSLIDFSSNDYLGYSGDRKIFDRAHRMLFDRDCFQNGATGSRLLSGNHPLYFELEAKLSEFHQTESALVFNSGYDANIGFFGCVPQRGDIVFYDEYVHASIRDGIKMGNAKSYKFGHNDLEDVRLKCQKLVGQPGEGNIPSKRDAEVYIITESVFSMDGDSPDLEAFSEFCQQNGYRLVVDEAHAVGVFGKNGEGLVQHHNLQDTVFARIVTFGKALGCHGAAILGSQDLKKYLINFARSLIYTTGLPPHSVATILSAYERLSASPEKRQQETDRLEALTKNILFFNRQLEKLELGATTTHPKNLSAAAMPKPYFIPSDSAIHCCIIPGNERTIKIAEKLQGAGFDVRAILSPTVPEGQERLRICLHSFNTDKEIGEMLTLLSEAITSQ